MSGVAKMWHKCELGEVGALGKALWCFALLLFFALLLLMTISSYHRY